MLVPFCLSCLPFWALLVPSAVGENISELPRWACNPRLKFRVECLDLTGYLCLRCGGSWRDLRCRCDPTAWPSSTTSPSCWAERSWGPTVNFTPPLKCTATTLDRTRGYAWRTCLCPGERSPRSWLHNEELISSPTFFWVVCLSFAGQSSPWASLESLFMPWRAARETRPSTPRSDTTSQRTAGSSWTRTPSTSTATREPSWTGNCTSRAASPPPPPPNRCACSIRAGKQEVGAEGGARAGRTHTGHALAAARCCPAPTPAAGRTNLKWTTPAASTRWSLTTGSCTCSEACAWSCGHPSSRRAARPRRCTTQRLTSGPSSPPCPSGAAVTGWRCWTGRSWCWAVCVTTAITVTPSSHSTQRKTSGRRTSIPGCLANWTVCRCAVCTSQSTC